MKVFVTGAGGFVGSHLMRALIRAECEVAALLRPGTRRDRLADLAGRFVEVTSDLGDTPAVGRFLDGWRPDACVHLAWYAEPGKYLDAAPENLASLHDSLALLQELVRTGCRRVVMTGTCAEYDTDAGFLREDGPTRPGTVYAAAKLSACLLGQQIAKAGGVRFAWARLFYLYGPGEDPRRMVPALLGALVRGEPFPASAGDQVRDYLHIEDAAAALLALARCGADGVFNVASGRPLTVRAVMETAGRVTGRGNLIRFGEMPVRAWDPPFICGDNRRLRALGWEPTIALETGLARLRSAPGSAPARDGISPG